jgi:hypothetical protein
VNCALELSRKPSTRSSRNPLKRKFAEEPSQLDSSHWAARQTPSLRFPRMPVRLLAGRCRRQRPATSHRNLHGPKSPPLVRTRGGRGAAPQERLSDAGNRPRSHGLVLSGRCELRRRDRMAGCVAASRWPLYLRDRRLATPFGPTQMAKVELYALWRMEARKGLTDSPAGVDCLLWKRWPQPAIPP